MAMINPVQRVILVDNEPKKMKLLSGLLKDRHPDFNVMGQFKNIEEAWGKIESGQVDGVFLDISWGTSNTDIKGFDLAERFKRIKPKPWIIFVSGYPEHGMRAFKDYEAKDFIETPITHDELKKALDKVRTETKGVNLSTDVFIVHGRDELYKTQVARFVEKLGFKATILHEQPNLGKTIIEKIEEYTHVGYAIVIYTPDDVGNTQAQGLKGDLLPRARQNVVFEHGYLIAKLGRDKVAALIVDNIELPSDIRGIVYVNSTNWQMDIANEMKRAGYEVNFNVLLS